MFETLSIDFVLKLLVNTTSVVLLIYGCYMRHFSNVGKTESGPDNQEYATSFLLFSVGVFIVTFMLHSVEISMGFAFGLFAVFSMLRYRTESISVKEMTYLFLVIGISLLSAVGPLSLVELSFLHLIVVASATFCENILIKPTLLEQQIQYENVEHIQPKDRDILIDELKRRTGLNIQHVNITAVDFVRDIASLQVFYLPTSESLDVKMGDQVISPIQFK